MPVEGLWTVEFQVEGGWTNGGVVVLNAGRLFGGDSQYYYLGTYAITGETLQGELQVRHYHGEEITAFRVRTKGFEGHVQAQVASHGKMAGIILSPTPSVSAVHFRMTPRHLGP